MRSQSAIKTQITKRRQEDLMGIEWPFYVDALSYEAANEYIRGEITEADWAEHHKIKNDEDAKQTILAYLPFAWEKANGFRGLSAQRSIGHFIAWTWLFDSEAHNHIKQQFHENYEFYGKDILVYIGDRYGFDTAEHDDGVRLNDSPEVEETVTETPEESTDEPAEAEEDTTQAESNE